MIGRLLWEVSPGVVGSEFERRYRKVMAEREKQVFETFTSPPPRRWHEVRAFPLGEGIGVAFRDATERLRMFAGAARSASSNWPGSRGSAASAASRSTCATASAPALARISALHGLPADDADESLRHVGRAHPSRRSRADAASIFSALAAGADRATRPNIASCGPIDGARPLDPGGRGDRARRGRARAVALVGAHIDITERKGPSSRPPKARSGCAPSTDALPLLISYIDRDQVFRFVNKTYEIWFERPLHEIVGRKVARGARRGDVCGAAAESRTGARGRGASPTRSSLTATGRPASSPRSSMSRIATRADACSAFT